MEEKTDAEQRNATSEEDTEIFENPGEGLEKATFAAGCFWEEAFRQIKVWLQLQLAIAEVILKTYL